MQYCQSNETATQQYIKKQSGFEAKTKKQGLIAFSIQSIKSNSTLISQNFYITARAGIDSLC